MSTSNTLRLLNLGCGHRIHADWVNVDLRARCPGVIEADLSKGVPFPDAEFDAVYHSAMLEHLRHEHVLPFLRECRRVLRPGGAIRIAVPDLETICRTYLQKLEAAARAEPGAEFDHQWMMIELLDQAVRERSGGMMITYLSQQPLPNEAFVFERIGEEGRAMLRLLRGQQQPAPAAVSSGPAVRPWSSRVRNGVRRRLLSWLLGPDGEQALAIGRFRLGGEVHQWMYDRVSLPRVLSAAGFADAQTRTATESGIPGWRSFHLDALPNGEAIKPDLFYMEAVKP